MTLEVRVSNAVAISLYEKLGFQKGGIRKRYYTDNHEDAYSNVGEFIMKKDQIILGIETSCDETAAAVIKNGTEIIE